MGFAWAMNIQILNMKNFYKTVLLFKSKNVRLEKMFPMSKLRHVLPTNLNKLVSLSFGKASGVTARIRHAYNFIAFVERMHKHHGTAYTVKWMKASHVALQKFLGGDKISSLRSIEPNVPLPRLINGCPAIITKADRKLIREGHAGVTRY